MKLLFKLQIFNSIWTLKSPCRFFSLCCRGFAPQNISGYESPSLYKDLPEHFNFASDVLDKWSQMEKNGERDSSIPALWWVGDQGNEVRWSFEELGFLSRKAANVLSDACGLKKGDRVIVMLPRIPEWWSITVGCIRTGIIYIPATTQLTANDIFYRLQASKAKCIITNDTLAPVVDSVVSKCQFLKIRLMVSEGSRDGWLDFKELLKAAHGDHNPVKTKSQEAMTIYFTSGTTGYPKMVEHSHSSFGIGMTSTGRFWLDLNPSDILWGLSDPGWVKFAYGCFFSPWIQGACIFTHSMLQFEATTVLNCLSRFPITSFCGTPTVYRMLAHHDLTSYKFKSLKHCLSGGEPLNPEVMEKWKSKTGMDIYEGYGQTETVLICSVCKGMKIKPGAMGKASPPYDVQVIDENANILPPGKEGDIAIRIKPTRPFCLFSHYVDDPEKTAASERGDFYITGDRGIVDEDGYFWFVGRADDVILSSGYRIGPFEVENALIEHPAVAEAAVVSSPDPIRGEVVKAFVILSPDVASHDPEKLTKELQEHVKKVTAPYKYPRKRGDLISSAQVTTHSSSAQLTMQSPENRKRAPAWTAREVLDLIAIWGEDSVLTELRSKRRNEKVFERISKAMTDKGHSRDSVQCRVKVKELRQGYQKTKEANGRSGAGRKTCRFYAELHAILGGCATRTPPLIVDSEVGVVISSMAEDYADGEDEDEEEEEDLAESTQHSVSPSSQELFLTLTELPSSQPSQAELPSSQPSQATIPDNDAMEGSSAANFSTIPPPSQRLAQIRRRKKKTRDEMFSDIMEVTRNERAPLNEWKDVVSNYRKEASEREERRDEREDRRDNRDERWRQEDRQENQRWRQEDQRWRDATLGLLRDQTDMLRRLVELQERQQDHRVPLQPLYNHPHPSPCSTSSSPRCVRTRGGEAPCTRPLHPRGQPNQKAVVTVNFF